MDHRLTYIGSSEEADMAEPVGYMEKSRLYYEAQGFDKA